MQTRREYLVGLGLAKAGRGKFSKDALAALDAARAKGVKFSDDDAPAKPVKAKAEIRTDEPKAEPVKDARDTPYMAPDEYRFPEGEYRAVSWENGKRKVWSLRECCNVCRVSLVNHSCDHPTILGNIVVKIEKVPAKA